ncbi:MAG: hypothetical protein D6767_08185, partial [Candidatus Hydrogenedentota bacterium]
PERIENIKISIMPKAFLKVLTFEEIDLATLAEYFKDISELFFMDEGTKFLYSLLVYIYGTTELQPEDVGKVVKQIAKGKEDIAMTTAERLVQQGLEQGLQQGLEQGLEQGLQQGEYKKAIETARRMKDLGAEIDFILKATGLTEKDLKENGIL